MRGIALAAALLFLAGCASAGPTTVAGVAHDLRQRGVDPASVVVPFEVTDEMRTWVHAQVADVGSPEQRLDHLLAAIVTADGLGLTYEGGSTSTAREAFAARKANCLGFTSLFVGMARELGISAFYLGVDDVERFERDGDLEGAEAAYRKALEVNPQGAAAYQNLAALLRLRGHAREADDLLALSTRASAQSPFSYLALGDLSLSQGRLDEARRYYRRAMWLNRDDPEPYAALGLAALAGGDRREAEKWFRKASAKDK